MRKYLATLIMLAAFPMALAAQGKSLHQLQQEFVDLRFGMFVHFGLPTFQNADWTDPDLDASVFNPTKLDTRQWVNTARSAGCKFICVSVKHHAGFCMWNTATTDYNVMNTPLGRDVLKELTAALSETGMQVMFHFSILDTHHRIRPTLPFTPEKKEFIKAQLRELLTSYGPVNTIMFDGWDAPWGRISYSDVSFPEIYSFVKSLQPDCLVMDLNGSKYPKDALFYSDISCYEQGAGEKISAEENQLPSMACYPLQRTWFWKESFPTDELKDVDKIVEENIIPYNKAYCTYILNAAPNREGLIDPNAVEAMARIGRIWKNTGHLVDVPEAPEPITDINIAVGRTCDSSWSDDMNLMDFANDDNFRTCWVSSPEVKSPWWKAELDKGSAVNMVVLTEGNDSRMAGYTVEVFHDGAWKTVDRQGVSPSVRNRVHISRFETIAAEAVRVSFSPADGKLSIAEIGVYGATPTQRRQSVYSYLEIYDLQSRTRRVVKEFPYLIEAPNWTPDAKWLVINKGGRLFKIAPDGSTDLIEIETGDVTGCNNDHVISPDGKWIGISANDPVNKKDFNSYVYTLPSTGGRPKKLTPLGPSYLHGISPDGRTVSYCAFRDPADGADVYTMPVKGGKEKRLTDAPGLDDGPEFSPDGKYIWFNSVRSGMMQIWRMRNDGRQQTQMTFDNDMNSWFPHVSPDGKKVVFIAYHGYEIDPGSHVANLNVQLRMIPSDGGEPEVLTELFGGQGSLNVNSWSPDSRQFAFVSYRLAEEVNAPEREMSVQLYSVRSLIGTPELFAANHKYVLGRLAQMGYTAVEAASYDDGKFSGLTPEEFKSAVEEAGLKILSSHTTRPLSESELSTGDFSQALSRWDKCISAHKAAGIPYLVMSWSPLLKTKAEMAVMASYLDAIGAKCREAGLRFGYHCHSHEFKEVDGTTMIDVFATLTKPENVFIQMDVYWAVMAGASPVEYIKKYPGRYELLHIKDKYEIGRSGMVGFDAIFKEFPVAGTKAFVVELEQASTPNILKGLRESAIYLRNGK